MKYYLLIFFVFFTCASVHSQTIVDGYYIDLDNHSVEVEIKVPKTIFSGVNIERLERKLTSVDSSRKGFEKFRPSKIKGFSFTYKNEDYNFRSKSIKGSTFKFFRLLSVGRQASVYYYYQVGDRSVKYKTFIVENGNGDDLVLKNSMSRKRIKKRLIIFFHNNLSVQKILETKALSIKNLENSLKKIVETINNLL